MLGYDFADAQTAAREVARVMRDVPGVADVQISRENYPQWSVVVDREKAATAGLSQRDVAQAALFSLNSNVSVNPPSCSRTRGRATSTTSSCSWTSRSACARRTWARSSSRRRAGGPWSCPRSPRSSGAWPRRDRAKYQQR